MKPDMTKDLKLGIENMSVGYNGKALISDICLSLAPGEIMTLIGPNGAGKSTILKSITRHLSLIAGTVTIDGRDMKQMSGRDVATRLAVVLTERVHAEMMTCEELVSAGRYPYTGSFGLLTAKDKEIVRHALEQVHALDIADQEVTSLSDGQRQRILLARAICQEPEIIVLDEPTSFLDIRHKIELLEILHSMARGQGITVVMSLHEIDLAEKISDKIVCVKGESIAAWGTPREIFSDGTIRELYGIEKGSFTTLLSLKSEYHPINILIALVANALVVYIVLVSIGRIEKVLGKAGIYVLRKFFGIILLAIAARLFTTNLMQLLHPAG